MLCSVRHCVYFTPVFLSCSALLRATGEARSKADFHRLRGITFKARGYSRKVQSNWRIDNERLSFVEILYKIHDRDALEVALAMSPSGPHGPRMAAKPWREDGVLATAHHLEEAIGVWPELRI